MPFGQNLANDEAPCFRREDAQAIAVGAKRAAGILLQCKYHRASIEAPRALVGGSRQDPPHARMLSRDAAQSADVLIEGLNPRRMAVPKTRQRKAELKVADGLEAECIGLVRAALATQKDVQELDIIRSWFRTRHPSLLLHVRLRGSEPCTQMLPLCKVDSAANPRLKPTIRRKTPLDETIYLAEKPCPGHHWARGSTRHPMSQAKVRRTSARVISRA